jgi:hypothetical protein
MSTQSPKPTEPGYFKSKPVSWSAERNNNGKPFINVKFENGLYWRKFLVGGAIQIAADALFLMGFKGKTANDINKDQNALDRSKEVDISVDWIKNADGSYYLKEGKKVLEVTGVWPPYQKKEISQADQIELAGIDLRGYLQNSKNNLGTPVAKESKEALLPPASEYNSDNIPF